MQYSEVASDDQSTRLAALSDLDFDEIADDYSTSSEEEDSLVVTIIAEIATMQKSRLARKRQKKMNAGESWVVGCWRFARDL